MECVTRIDPGAKRGNSPASSAATCSLLAAALCFASTALAGNNWNVPHRPFHLVGNVHYVGTAGIGSYLITTPAGNILLDGGTPQGAKLIERNIEDLGYKLRDTKYLLNSHAHFDHAGGLAQLKRDTGATLVVSEADAPLLEAGHHDSYGGNWGYSFPRVHPDRLIHDGDTVRLGGVTMTAMLTPGHTKGCTTWLLNTEQSGRRLRVIFYGSTSVPGYPLQHNREYPNIVDDYQATFEKLKHTEADVFLSNHTELFNMDAKLLRVSRSGPNPFIDPQELARVVAASEADFKSKLASIH